MKPAPPVTNARNATTGHRLVLITTCRRLLALDPRTIKLRPRLPPDDAVRARRRRVRENRGDDEAARDDRTARRPSTGHTEGCPRQGGLPDPGSDPPRLRGNRARPRREDGHAGPRSCDRPR